MENCIWKIVDFSFMFLLLTQSFMETIKIIYAGKKPKDWSLKWCELYICIYFLFFFSIKLPKE